MKTKRKNRIPKRVLQNEPEPVQAQEDAHVPQTMDQKKMSFVNSGHLEAVLQILRECSKVDKLVGESEFDTIVNAVRLDAYGDMIKGFISIVDDIKKGGLFRPR